MRVFVTGGTGFTGSRVVPLLIKNGYQVRCLYRQTSNRSPLSQLAIEWVQGDLSDSNTLSNFIRGTDVLVNMASLGFGHADSIIQAARAAGIQRAIFISTTAIFTTLNARSKSIRLAAENAIQSSGLQYTILRPTMIYGGPRDRNMWRLIRFMRVSPVVPVFGDGNSLQQPIHVDDAAQAVLGSLLHPEAIGKAYQIAGKYPLTYNEVIGTIAHKMKRRVWKLHLPTRPVISLLEFLERVNLPAPIKAEQVLRLNENKSFDYEEAQRDFGFGPLGFDEGIALELVYLQSTISRSRLQSSL